MICSKAGSTLPGTVHLTTHHLIFAYDDAAKDEMWVSVVLMNMMRLFELRASGSIPNSLTGHKITPDLSWSESINHPKSNI